MLEYRPYIYPVIDGRIVSGKLELAPPGWFERKCREADCEWFIQMAKRMAEGEHVPLEEIQAAYLAHNGKSMPCGKWSQLFQ
jgi:hypothetical protein